MQRCVKQGGREEFEWGKGGYGRRVLPKSTSLTYTRGDAPVRLWNTELTYRSVRHWSEIVQRNIRDWHIGMCSVYSVVSDVI